MSLPGRVGILILGFLVVVGGAIFVVIQYFLAGPPVVDYTTVASGNAVNVVMEETAQTSSGSRPDWVTYFIQDPRTHQWVHTTLFKVPANTRVNMTVYGYDGCTPLRNPYWGRVTGTIGGVEYVNGTPTSVLDSWGSCSVGHTFSIPQINLNVPMASPTTLAANNDLCSTSPCNAGPHQVITFSFNTPRAAGNYFWQCRIPCGLGYLDGFGGPMQTIGYMTGTMEVAS